MLLLHNPDKYDSCPIGMAKTTRRVTLALTGGQVKEFLRMAQALGQTPDKFATDAVLEYRQTLKDNPYRIDIIRREASRC